MEHVKISRIGPSLGDQVDEPIETLFLDSKQVHRDQH